MALPLELEPLNLELNPKIYTADLRATLLTWGPIVAGLGFMYAPALSTSSAASAAFQSRRITPWCSAYRSGCSTPGGPS